MTTKTAEAVSADKPKGVDLSSVGGIKFRVRSVISGQLQGQGAWAVASRAQLRSALRREVGSVPAIWSLTLADDFEKFRGDEPTRGERAIHTALTLWAFHQGSHTAQMHREWEHERSIGAAVRQLAQQDRGSRERDEEHPVYKRLCAMIAAPTFGSLATHARGLIGLLKSHEIPMDYGRFAADLFNWQDPHRRSAVLRAWGRDFARRPSKEGSQNQSATAATYTSPENH